jgi:hypothetical protein
MLAITKMNDGSDGLPKNSILWKDPQLRSLHNSKMGQQIPMG